MKSRFCQFIVLDKKLLNNVIIKLALSLLLVLICTACNRMERDIYQLIESQYKQDGSIISLDRIFIDSTDILFIISPYMAPKEILAETGVIYTGRMTLDGEVLFLLCNNKKILKKRVGRNVKFYFKNEDSYNGVREISKGDRFRAKKVFSSQFYLEKMN